MRLIPPQFVRPFVKSNKNDYKDAEAIAEAVQRPTMRFVPIKTQDQLDLQALHRVRDRLVSRRTAVVNQVRAFLLERGNHLPPRPEVPAAAHAVDPGRRRTEFVSTPAPLLDQLWQEWKALASQIEAASQQIERVAEEDTACQRSQQIPWSSLPIFTSVGRRAQKEQDGFVVFCIGFPRCTNATCLAP